MEKFVLQIDINEILNILPHRYPFILIDRVTELNENESVKAIKNVTINEPFFQGHFPGKPVFPGVLMLEAMAQSTGVLAFKSNPDFQNESLYLFVGIDKARFKRQVIPGDVMEITATLLKKARNMWKFSAEIRVDGELACSAQLMGAITQR